MKVLELIPSLETGGAQRIVALLSQELSRLGCDVTVVALYPQGDGVVEGELERSRTSVRFLNKRRGPDLRMYFRLRNVIASLSPDVIHTHLHSLRYAWLFAGGDNQPCGIHTIHNLAERETDLAGRMIRRRARRRGWRLVCCSREVLAGASRLYGSSGIVEVPNGVAAEPFVSAALPRPSRSGVRLLCVGRLSGQKSPLSVLEAFRAAQALTSTGLYLDFLGSGALAGELGAAIRKLGLDSRVRLLGERSDVAACLAEADIFVLGSRFEGLPMAAIEAMLSGLPVVATRVGGLKELVEEGRTGYLCPAGDTVGMAGAIAKLADSAERRFVMGSAARYRAQEHFSSARMAQSYFGLFQNCLHQRPTTA